MFPSFSYVTSFLLLQGRVLALPVVQLLGDDFDAAQVLTQDFRNHDGAVSTLVLLYDGGENAGRGQTGAVQGVNEVDLAVGTAVTDVAAAGLEITGIGDGGNFLIAVHGGGNRFGSEFKFADYHIP